MIFHWVFLGLIYSPYQRVFAYHQIKLYSLIALILASTCAQSAESLFVDVSHINGIYKTKIHSIIKSNPSAVRDRLTSYNNLNAFNRLIQNSYLSPNGHLVLELRACFTFLCFEKKQTLNLIKSKDSITGTIIPEHSDFKSGWMRWSLKSIGDNSAVEFSSEMTPDFWVPPYLGPLFIEYKLTKEAKFSVRKLEELTNSNINPH